MKIIRVIFRIVLIMLILFLVTRIFKRADKRNYEPATTAFFSKGNAPDSIRMEVIKQLRKFQEGYSARDVSQIGPYMESLYSKNNILILGTMPREIFIGYKEATGLVKSDWESWGDCRFVVDSASISSEGNSVWIATTGYVKFDLSSLLVIPLRLTGIMVKEEGSWKFRQQQFQFDIDFGFSMIATIVLFIWLIVTMINLGILTIKRLKAKSRS